MRFLIVDDSKAMQTIVRRTLVAAGYTDHEFQYAFNGQEALEIITEWKPDIVLSDWHMPEMTGIELLKKIRKEGIKAKVGLVTTERSRERVQEAKEAGALFIVSKPFNAETLHDAVEDALHQPTMKENAHHHDLILPNPQNISRAMNSFSRHKISITQSDTPEINYNNHPFMAGLYDNPDTRRTLGAIILDVSAVCNIGASMQDLSVKEAKVAIDNHFIPKSTFDMCKSLISLISTLIHDRTGEIELDIRAIHLVNKPNGKLKTLIDQNIGKGKSYDVEVDGYGKGKIILLRF